MRREFVNVVKCRVQGHVILQATDLARGQSLEPFAVIDLPAARAARQHGCQQLAAANNSCALFSKMCSRVSFDYKMRNRAPLCQDVLSPCACE